MINMIQPLVQELYQFLVLAPWWPSQESDWTEIWSVSGTYVQIFGSIAHSWFPKMAAWRPYFNSDRAEVW
jgi:hypothetical protein